MPHLLKHALIIFFYALFEREFPRATVDIDLLGQRMQNNPEEIAGIFREVFSINADRSLASRLLRLKTKSTRAVDFVFLYA